MGNVNLRHEFICIYIYGMWLLVMLVILRWEWKKYSTLLFSVKEQGLETRKLRKLLAKEDAKEVQEDAQKVV